MRFQLEWHSGDSKVIFKIGRSGGTARNQLQLHRGRIYWCGRRQLPLLSVYWATSSETSINESRNIYVFHIWFASILIGCGHHPNCIRCLRLRLSSRLNSSALFLFSLLFCSVLFSEFSSLENLTIKGTLRCVAPWLSHFNPVNI